MMLGLSVGSTKVVQEEASKAPTQSVGKIYLYGEAHGVKKYWIKNLIYGATTTKIKV